MQKLLFSLSIISIGLVVGYIIQKLVLKGIIKADVSLAKQRKILQKIALLALNPIATVGAIWILSFDNVRIFFMPFIGLFAILLGGFTSLLIGKILKLEPKQAGSFFSCGGMFNIGSIGALVVYIFLGESAFALVPMYQLFEPIIYYTVWFPIAKSFSPDLQEVESRSQKLLKIISDPFVLVSLASILIGILLNLMNVARPTFYSKLNSIVIPTASLLLLISIGMAMKFSRIKAFMKPSIIIALIKFLMIPVVATGLAYILGFGKMDDGLPLKVILILTSMPVGFTALVPPSIYNLDIDLANASWMLTTALLVVVIPLQMLIISFM